jgi:hypothetical protein
MAHLTYRRLGGVALVVASALAACVSDEGTNVTVVSDGGTADGATEHPDGSSLGPDAGADAASSKDGGDAATTTCGNKTRDGDETDVDCGGSCSPCLLGKKCTATADCASGLCTTLTCAPWQGTLPGTDNDYANAIAVDAQGNVYVAGDFFGDLNLGPNGFTKLTTGGSCDAVVAKLAPNGDHLWSKRFGGTACDSANAIAVDAQGDVYVLGTALSSSVDFGKGGATSHKSTNANYDLFVLRLSGKDGATVWSTTFGAGAATSEVGIPRGFGMALDPTNVWIAANATAATDYGAGTLSPSAEDALVLRVSQATGSFVSAKLFGSAQGDAAQAVTADAKGVYVGGFIGDATDFGLGTLLTKGTHDGFVLGFDFTGTLKWQRAIGGNNPARPFGSDQVHALDTDGVGGLYVAGLQSGGPMDLGGGITAPAASPGGAANVFAAAYKTDGTPRWATTFGGAGVNTAYGVTSDRAGHVLMLGYTEAATLDVGSGPVTHGLTRDAFISVLSDSTGVPQQGRFFGRTGTSESASLARRPGTSSVYAAGAFTGSLQATSALMVGDAGADLQSAAKSDGWFSSLGNVP